MSCPDVFYAAEKLFLRYISNGGFKKIKDTVDKNAQHQIKMRLPQPVSGPLRGCKKAGNCNQNR